MPRQIALDTVPIGKGKSLVISTVDKDGWLVKAPETSIRVSGSSHRVVMFDYPNTEQARGGHSVWLALACTYPDFYQGFIDLDEAM